MKGFDDEFATLDDYIRIITERIWAAHGRGVERIHDYYSADCAVITPSGATIGVDAVVLGTQQTLQQFPDRRLLCEDIVSAGDADSGWLSSHRIASPMTHLGHGAFGPPGGARVKARTVADCVCKDNRIVHEWLVRDQGAIAAQVGSNAREMARRWLEVRGPVSVPLPQPPAPAWWRDPMHESAGAALLAQTYRAVWHSDLSALRGAFDEAAELHLPGGETGLGVADAESFWFDLCAAFAGATFTIESLAERIEPGRTPRVAMRWRVQGRHVGGGRYGPATQRSVDILGITHAEVQHSPTPRILREWVLIDEVALWMQLL